MGKQFWGIDSFIDCGLLDLELDDEGCVAFD